MEQTTEPGRVGAAFLGSVADLITVKGVVLVLFLSVITGVSLVLGSAAHGFVPGAVLVVLLAAAVAFEYVRNRRLDYVGAAAVVVVSGYTALEYIGTLQNLWFPVSSAALLLATAGYGAWREDVSTAAEFVENLDVVGLHGGVLLLIYALLLGGAPLEFIYAPVFPAVLLLFAVSLLVTTVAYAARSPSVDSDELHHRLVSVVRGLGELDDEDDRDKLGEHVRAVAQALTGVALPSAVTVEDGPVPVVLPASGPAVYEADGVDDLLSRARDSGVTGYAVDAGDVVLFKNGKPTRYYLADEDRFGHPEALPDGRFGEADLYTAAYVFVDAVESVAPEPGEAVEADEWAEDAVDRVEDVQGAVDTLLGADTAEAEGEPGEEVGGRAEDTPEPHAATEPTETTETETAEPAATETDSLGADEDEEEPLGADDEARDGAKIDVGGDEIDLDEMFEKADEMFD